MTEAQGVRSELRLCIEDQGTMLTLCDGVEGVGVQERVVGGWFSLRLQPRAVYAAAIAMMPGGHVRKQLSGAFVAEDSQVCSCRSVQAGATAFVRVVGGSPATSRSTKSDACQGRSPKAQP